MDELKVEQSESAIEEVVLRYEAQPKEVVHYYVQPTQLPRFAQITEEPFDKMPPRRKKGLRIFLVILAIALVTAGIALLAAKDRVSFSFHGEFGTDGKHFSYETGVGAAVQTMPYAEVGGDARVLYKKQGSVEKDPADIFDTVGRSVVTVVGEMDYSGNASVGTGIIFSEDGYIVTNAHVVENCHTCFVTLYTGGTYTASLVGADAATDLAVIKIEADGLRPAEFGDSNALRVGDKVYAIGNPLGIELVGTFTDGIVSSLERAMTEDVALPLIQTNTALNSGNSGGPLINRYGQVVGINTMKIVKPYRTQVGVEGIGFAIPISDCAYLINNLVRTGRIGEETVLGITVLTTPTTLPDGTHALEIESVTEDGPGDKAGIRGGDFLISADGEALEKTIDLLRIRRSHEPGEALSLVIWRDGVYLEYDVYPQ